MFKIHMLRVYAHLTALFGKGPLVAFGVILATIVALTVLLYVYVNASAPNSITMTSGPVGSNFQKNADKYKAILAKQGVTLNVLPSEGSVENFKRLLDPKEKVDVGFVLSGEIKDTQAEHLWSLGSVSYQPLMVFYRGAQKNLLSDFKGGKLNIDEEGSGAHDLALTLLKANGIEPGGSTELLTSVKGEMTQSLLSNRVDAIFVMGDSTSGESMQKLLHTPEIRLFNFIQADAYARRIHYLNKLVLPRGALDFGSNTPPEDINLVAPAVELVARDTLHPALSDLLLDAAREVHGKPGLFKNRGEFPAPIEHEIQISPDAARFYTSGKGFLYRTFPFRIASIIARTLAVVVPLAILLVPALKLAPAIYRWRIQSRINRWYRLLLNLERDAEKQRDDQSRRQELLRHLDHIENTVNKIAVPASFGDIFYGLRGHIDFVRERLRSSAEGGDSSPDASETADSHALRSN
jgi:TRAP-type uncharacterized transport system substrate-binding protein